MNKLILFCSWFTLSLSSYKLKTEFYIMKSDPKECLYCQNNETLNNLMIEIAQLSVSRVFLFKEQTYRGRCLVAYKDHVNDLNELKWIIAGLELHREIPTTSNQYTNEVRCSNP